MHRRRVLGVLAGTDFDLDALLRWGDSADLVIAADGAANRLFEGGLTPDIVIGDMDSIEDQWRSAEIEWIEVSEQSTTDCDKMLALANSRYPNSDFVVVGLEGDRFDHVLANIQSLVKSHLELRILLRAGLGYILNASKPLEIPTQEGQTISVIAITECTGFEMSGVKWTPSSKLGPIGAASVSNICTNAVVARLTSGVAIVIVVQDVSMPVWKGLDGCSI